MAVTEVPGKVGPVTAPKQPATPKVQSYWNLVWWKLSRNRLALMGGVVVALFYFVCVLFPEFFAPYPVDRQSSFLETPPQRLHFFDQQGQFHFPPFVYCYTQKVDPIRHTRTYEVDTSKQYPIPLFTRGDPYQLWGVIPADLHLFGPGQENTDAPMFLLGTDRTGRDMLSRIIYGGRLSLLLGLIGQIITLSLGSLLGAASGY